MKIHLSLFLAFCLPAFGLTLAQQKKNELKTQIEIRGVVKDHATLLPVQNAIVRLSDSKDSVKTNERGGFRLLSPDSSAILIVASPFHEEKRVELEPTNAKTSEILLTAAKQRLIVTTDIGGTDPDDEQSMVHLLVSANEFDIEGLICGLAWDDNKIGVDVLNPIIDAYGEVLSNLKVHADGYPSYEYLKSIVKTGQPKSKMLAVGEGKDSPGSDLIIAGVDKEDDPRPIWINAWGGANTIAQALWKVKSTRTAEQVELFVRKIRVHDILGQDDAGAWMTNHFPNLIYIRNRGVYGWAPEDSWVHKYVQDKGILGEKYRNRIWATEGDSPAFMHIYTNGLNDPEKIDQGGWGGRFNLIKESGIRSMDIAVRSGIDETKYDPYQMYTNTAEGGQAINRWKEQIWNNLAARMLWSVTDKYADANHHPMACVDGDCTQSILEYWPKAGSAFELNATGSADPDGDELVYNWSFYKEPGSYAGSVDILNAQLPIAEVAIPKDAVGKTIHIILQLSDRGTPCLTKYRRVILNVR